MTLFRQLSIFLNFYYTQGSVLESEKDIKYIKKKKKRPQSVYNPGEKQNE